MRLVSFVHGARSSYGVVGDDGGSVADAGAVLGGRHADLGAVLTAGDLGRLAEAARRAPVLALDDVVLRSPLPAPPRIFCIGLNYKAHREETGRDELAHPTVFVRFASSLAAPGAPLERPIVSEAFDYEGELAVVIGRRGRHIGAAEALGHVAGYSCFNDASVRDWQRHTTQFTPGKNFDRSGSFGPWIVTADEIPDPRTLTLTTRLGSEVVQQSSVDLLIFDIPALIAYLSTFTELLPGDVIATGTPGGVGMARTPPRWMQPGEVVEVDIDGIGVLRNPIGTEGTSA
jgi:2-keto-4-pentenoate hydratase/2-oxohepta-3-ene-1,7-dioic acid hydratase in catechol pathway